MSSSRAKGLKALRTAVRTGGYYTEQCTISVKQHHLLPSSLLQNFLITVQEAVALVSGLNRVVLGRCGLNRDAAECWAASHFCQWKSVGWRVFWQYRHTAGTSCYQLQHTAVRILRAAGQAQANMTFPTLPTCKRRGRRRTRPSHKALRVASSKDCNTVRLWRLG